MKFKNFFQKSFYYFLISGVITLLAIIYNYILIEFLKVNLNLTFLTSFFIFGFLSYAGNSIFNFKQKILGMNTKGMDFNLTIPALSYNMIILKKI